MAAIVVTLEVLNLDTSNDLSSIQQENIQYMSVTSEVSKLDIFNDINE
jgi:hypothetical protein